MSAANCDCGYGEFGVYIHAPDCPAMIAPDPRTDNVATGIMGKRIDRAVTDESEHFYLCADCGQAVDMRDLGQVFHHEDAGHKPLAVQS